jgi:hypothetical protein
VADKNGMTPLYAAVDMNTIQTVWGRPMPLLEDATNPAAMVQALLKHGANPDIPILRPIIGRHTRNTGDSSLSEGTTALARAAKSGDATLMKVLLDGGANPHATQADLTTVAMIAASGGGQRVYPGSASVSTPATEEDARSIAVVGLAPIRRLQHQRNGDPARPPWRRLDRAYLAERGQARMQDRRGRTPSTWPRRRQWTPRRPPQVHEHREPTSADAIVVCRCPAGGRRASRPGGRHLHCFVEQLLRASPSP